MRRDEYREALSRLDILEHNVSGVKAGIADLHCTMMVLLPVSHLPCVSHRSMLSATWEATQRREHEALILMIERCGGHSPGATAQIGHLTRKKIGHMSNIKIPQLSDAAGGFFWYNTGN